MVQETEFKELICTTHGHELRGGGNAGGLGGAGQSGDKGGKIGKTVKKKKIITNSISTFQNFTTAKKRYTWIQNHEV